ncbi:ubiquitin-like-conjugating enzyme ATG10 isoform X2 [Thalassophryne amazonica]|uniref:ubiquitin-like-conjugating enzyme ATG10 isoform X2 n=1 Tax=Thalassophryne amazonica TaxID=390379 RepID=UPI001470F88E|nr:ubiquitin-like-conjugating enzyme ATG10 isoform X2 [Thalassophryne amazonica]
MLQLRWNREPDLGPNRQRSAEMTSFVLDEESFYQCCSLLLQRSQQLRDDWTWEPGQGTKEGYLRKTAVRSVITDSEPETIFGPDHQGQELQQHHPAAAGCFHGNHDDDDDGVAVAASKSCCHVHRYEYHILYSCSFRTPVLYFRASTLEGRSLSLEEVWSSVHQNYRRRLQHHPLDTITQQEHPVLGQPFFMLHPCRTDEFMRPLLQAAQLEHRPRMTARLRPVHTGKLRMWAV